MKSIPASADVNVIPGVLGTGGNPLSLNTVMATNSIRPPIGTVPSFPNALAVSNFFGPDSMEALLAGVYFSGFNNCTRLPGVLYFAQYNETDVAGYLRSGSFANVPLSTLTGFSGTLDVTIDGRAVTSANINLSSAVSYSNAAALIQTGLQTPGGIFSGTGSLAGTVATIVTTATGALHVGDALVGVGIPGGTTIASFGTYTVLSGVGTVNLSGAASTESTEALTVSSAATVTYDAQLAAFVITSPTTGAASAVGFATGGIATNLQFTQATGAVLSPGAVAATPASFLNGVAAVTQNWAAVMTVFDPDQATQVAFATWVNGSSPAGKERFIYVGETTDVTLTEGPAPSSFPGETAAFNGRVAVYSTTPTVFTNPDGTTYTVGDTYGKAAAFICGTIASINWAAPGGRITFKFRSNSQLVPSVVDATVAANLDSNGGALAANGTNYYGAIATANQAFQYLRQGGISGDWDWIDEYVDQIYLNSQFQLALLSFLTLINAVSYNDPGYAKIRGVMSTPIAEAVNNGSIQAGVVLSGSQVQALIAATGGIDISGVLFAQGWYLQILDPGATVRGLRGTPLMTFWYTDGGAIQQITLASIDIQ